MVVFGCRVDISEEKISKLEIILDILLSQSFTFQDFRAKIFPIFSTALW